MKYFRSHAIGVNASRDLICPAKAGKYPSDVLQSLDPACCEKIFGKDNKDNNHNSLHLSVIVARDQAGSMDRAEVGRFPGTLSIFSLSDKITTGGIFSKIK